MMRMVLLKRLWNASFVVMTLGLGATGAHAVVITFEGLGNGQKVDSPFEVSPLVDISGSGRNLGAAIFDSQAAGPNDFPDAHDADLIVGLGNVLIVQDRGNPADFGGSDFFEVPDDEDKGGTIRFDFVSPVTLLSIDLIDIDQDGATVLHLTDINGKVRSYDVPADWTTDVTATPIGWQTLDLTTLAAQLPAPSAVGGTATASEETLFDPSRVTTLEVVFAGSAALDNLRFIPEPGSIVLWILGALGLLGSNQLHRFRSNIR